MGASNPDIVDVATIKGVNCGFNLSATATATLFTVDSNKLVKINSIICANVDGTNAATLDLFVSGVGTTNDDGITITDGSSGAPAGSDIYLAKTVSVPADATLVVLSSPIYLMEGDILKGGANAASDLDLFISMDIIDDS
jgi:hypothetical protein